MTNQNNQVESIQEIRVLLFGMKGVFSHKILNILIHAGANVCGVLTPALIKASTALDPGKELPVLHKHSNKLSYLADIHHIPVLEVENLNGDSLIQNLQNLSPDLILIACFPFILPESIRNIARLGCFNIHPSLLPAYRGPMPLFWQFRNGEKNTGVTLHEVTDRLDAGDIILQEPIFLPDGTNGLQANIMCSKLGGSLAINALKLLVSGTLKKTKQNDNNFSYYSHPGKNDFIISTEWTAQRAFNFIMGTSHWNHEYEIVAGNQHFTAKSALSYSTDNSLEKDYEFVDDELWIRFTPGVLRVQQ